MRIEDGLVRRVAILLGASLLGALVTGCGGRPVVGELGQTDRGLTAADLSPRAQPGAMVTLDPGTLEVLGTLELRRDDLGGGRWEAVAVDPGEEAARRTTFVRTEDGVRMESFVAPTPASRGKKLGEFRFDPPLLVSPAELVAGEAVESESALEIVDLEDSDRVVGRGTATRRTELLGTQRVLARSGEIEAFAVSVRFELELGAMTIDNRSVLWIDPQGRGVLGEESSNGVRLLGARIRHASSLEWLEDELPVARGPGWPGADGRDAVGDQDDASD